MPARVLHESPALTILDYRCTAGPSEVPFVEVHARSSLSFVRRGSFGCKVGSHMHELVAGAVLVGRAGDEFMCTHAHHRSGDECLSFQLGHELAEPLALRSGSLPPTAAVMVLGQLAQAAGDGLTQLGVDEVAVCFCARFGQLTRGRRERHARTTLHDRRRSVRAALWLEAHAHAPIALVDVAAEMQLSPFHALRMFSRVLGVSPHQYLVRVRLSRAARLLADSERAVTDIAYEVGFADLSNFVRTFSRAASVSPRAFRRAAHSERKILQDRIAASR
jgi:AraC-like DNA-binding protein